VNNTGTKYVRIMKQTAFWGEREKMRVYAMIKIFSTYICWINLYILWIIQELNTLELWNKQYFEEREKNGEYIPCLKYSVPIFVE